MMLRTYIGIGVAVFFATLPPVEVAAEEYALVLANGQVMDPESGLNAIRNIAVVDGRIVEITESKLSGRQVVDVTGLVVAPGFIDFHAHGQDNTANRYQARDGVTTALDLEAGKYPVADYYNERAGNALLNYGVSVSHHGIRRSIWLEEEHGDRWAYAEASRDDIDLILDRFRQGLADGGIGAGFGLEYTPGVGYDEVYRVFKFMAANDAPVTVHVRRARGTKLAPHSNIAAIQEVLANAAGTGAALHIVHITPSGLGDTPTVLDMISGAREAGVDVSTEVYPYTAGSTSILSAAFDDGWQERLDITYEDLVWVATGERLSRKTFDKYRSQQTSTESVGVIAHFIPEEAMLHAVAHPLTHIASDGPTWITGREHPRGAGTYARVLGVHVRQRRDLDLMTAIGKMTFMPAERLQAFVPAMKNKGRIKAGADADITVFDPARVIDRATYENPMQYSEGIVHVLVGGEFVVRDEQSVEDVFPGRPVRLGE